MLLRTHLKSTLLLLLAFPILAACNAKFTDLRPNTDSAGNTDTSNGTDTAVPKDTSGVGDMAADLAGGDSSGLDATDGGTQDVFATDQTVPSETLIAKGTFKGNNSYPNISGDAMLVKKADGSIVFRVENVVMANVPGPAFVLANRDKLEGGLDANKGDLLVAGLQTPYQKSYEWVLSGGDTGQRNIVVYCVPFEVELGGGLLVDVP